MMLVRLLLILSCTQLLALVLPAARPVVPAAAGLRHSLRMLAEGDSGKGTCKWFDSSKGFGFIALEEGGADIFVHQSDIYAPGFRSLAEGEELEFKIATDAKTGKLKAVEVTGPDGGYVQGAPKPEFEDDSYY